MKPSVRDVLKKADITVSDLMTSGGYLNPEQANRFIDLVIDQPTILRSVRTVRMNAPQRLVEKVGFADRILRAAPSSGSYLADSDRAKPTTGKVQLTTKEIMAEVHLPYDVLEDNIERDNFEDTIMRHMAARAALDLEELLILGDTGSSDAYLALMDGLIKQITTNVVTASTGTQFGKAILFDAIKTMPSKYLRNRAEMRVWASVNNEALYRAEVATRETALGDVMLQGVEPVRAYGVPVVPAALMPDTQFVLTHPQNIIWGVQRQITVETERDIRARTLVIVLTLRIDMKLEDEQAAVLVTGLTAP